MIFSALYTTGANVYFIPFKLQENYWLVIDKIISLNRHWGLSALSKTSLTLIVITACSLARFAFRRNRLISGSRGSTGFALQEGLDVFGESNQGTYHSPVQS